MNKIILALITLLSFTSAFADSTEDAKKAEMMKLWQEAATPGTEHALLKTLVGKWKVTTKAWESETAKPEESVGTSTFKAILGGRFIQQDFKGKMMGMPYEGTGMLGFNKVTKKYESSWHDSMSTAVMNFEGTFNEETKTISESGEFQCPMKKGSQKMRSEMKMIDKNNMTFVLYMPDMVTEKEFKTMEQVYKRIK